QSLVAHSVNVAEYHQQSPIVVTAMGNPEDLESLVDWLPALELTNRSERVTVGVGTLHTNRLSSRRPRLRILVGNNATATQADYSDLPQRFDAQVAQSQ